MKKVEEEEREVMEGLKKWRRENMRRKRRKREIFKRGDRVKEVNYGTI